MPKSLLASLICLLFIYSCKKKTSEDFGTPTPEIAQLEQKLEVGKGTWKISSNVETYYDKNNNVLKTTTNEGVGYWVFSKDYYKGTDYTLYYWGNLSDPTTIESIFYSLSQQNGVYYMDVPGSQAKYKFQTLTETNISLVTPNVLQLSFYDGNTPVTADHATMAINLTKFQ